MDRVRYRRAADLLEAELGDELVGLDVQAGNCFGFNAVATSVWKQLREPKSFEEIRDALLDEYDVESDQCTSELRGLLTRMVEEHLVIKVAA